MGGFNYAEWLAALTGLGAVIYAGREYRRQREQTRLQLAQQLMERMEDDPLLHFAVTTLDAG